MEPPDAFWWNNSNNDYIYISGGVNLRASSGYFFLDMGSTADRRTWNIGDPDAFWWEKINRYRVTVGGRTSDSLKCGYISEDLATPQWYEIWPIGDHQMDFTM